MSEAAPTPTPIIETPAPIVVPVAPAPKGESQKDSKWIYIAGAIFVMLAVFYFSKKKDLKIEAENKSKAESKANSEFIPGTL